MLDGTCGAGGRTDGAAGRTEWAGAAGQGATGTAPSKPAGAGGQAGGKAGGQGGGKAGGQAGGQAGAGASKGSGTVSAADRTFVTHAAHGSMAEVALGKLAAQNALHADVKQFGQRMVDDHGKASTELMALASKNHIDIPSDLDAKHKADQARLAKLQGADFDRAYMTMMVAEHAKDVSEFQRASKTAKDADLKAFAAKTLPTLQEHRKMAQDITAKVKAAGGSTSGAKSPAAPK